MFESSTQLQRLSLEHAVHHFHLQNHNFKVKILHFIGQNFLQQKRKMNVNVLETQVSSQFI